MFTQPINQSGLSGFIPVRRQEGGVSNEELDIGQILEFDIFGRAIPKTTTNIGQIENPEELAPGLPQGISSLIPVDGGADDSFEGAPTFSPPDVDVSFDTVTEGVSNLAEDVSGKVAGAFEGGLQSKAAGFTAGAFAKSATNAALAPAIGKFAGPIGAFVGEFASQAIQGKGFNAAEMGLQAGLGLLSVAFPVLALPIALFNLARSIWGDPEPVDFGAPFDPDVVGPFGTIPGDFDGPEGPLDLEDMGYNIDMDIAPGGTAPSTGPEGESGIGSSEGFSGIGGPTGADDTSEPSGGGSSGSGSGSGSGGGDGPGSACWVAGTKVLMADNTYCNIEDLEIGDMVMSYPETKKTRRWNTPLEAKPIVSLLVDVHPEIWHLNDSMVSGTEWMIKGDGTAAIVQWLNIGDTVLGPDNNLIKVTRVEPAEGELKKQVIYNFETKDNYTYIADGMRTIRGRAVRGEQWGKDYLAGDTNAYEGSMQDEYDKKFKTYTS